MSWKVLEEIQTNNLGKFTEISGNYAIASDPSFNNGAANDGQVRIYERKSNGNWTEVYLKNGDASAAANFGESIDISGNYAVVGEYTYGAGGGFSYGRARFYERKNGVWEEIQIIVSPEGTGADAQFGRGVAISGNLAAIGAPVSATNAGRFYWYKRNVDNGQWEQVGEPVIGNWTSDQGGNGGQLGTNIKMSGNYAIVGEYDYGNVTDPAQGGFGNGRAYWYEYTNDSWKQVFFDETKVPLMTFGWGVGINGNYAIVGAPGIAGAGADNNPGYAYIYERKYDGEWKLIKSLEGENNLDLFGEFVSISGNYAMVGASGFENGGGDGRIYFYQRKKDGNWELIETNDGTGGQFGYAVSIDGNYAVGGGSGGGPGLPALLRFYQKSV